MCARRHFSQLSEFERCLIIGMKTAGWSTRHVAGQVDRSECAVRNSWEQRTRESTHARKTGFGATRKTTRREDRRIMRQALVDPTVSRLTIRADVGVAIVPQTISKHLAEANLKSKCPFRAIPLTHRSIGNCVYSGAKPGQCGMLQMGKSLCLVMNPGLFWGQMITVYGCGGALVSGTIPPNTVLRQTAHTAGVMVWGAIAYDSRSTLIAMRGTLTSQRYVDDILRPHVLPFINGLPGAIFQQDNARPHTARVAQDFLRHFQTLPWPDCFPDLSLV
ncbi:transposable element Tcb1 transposase [Trichonephila clavipes]|nr:transposable element Tcb1 transposase [Trichonephila clavipes]